MKLFLLMAALAASATWGGSATTTTSPLAFAADPLVRPELSLTQTIKQLGAPQLDRSRTAEDAGPPTRPTQRRPVFRTPIIPPAPDVDYKLRVQAPDPSVDYKLRVVEPDEPPK